MDLLKIENKNLAIADLAGIGGFFDCLDYRIEHFALDRGLDFYLGQKIDHVFRAAIQLGMAFLPSESLDLGNGDALHADRGQRLAYLVKLERLCDFSDLFYGG